MAKKVNKSNEIILEALSNYGTKEMSKGKFNPKVIAMIKKTTGMPIFENTPWCAAFVNAILADLGYLHSTSLVARDCLKFGKNVKKPELGDVVVLWSQSKESWKGHVGFYMGISDGFINILGGNQSNQVCVSRYPIYRLLGYRRASKALLKTV